MTELQTQIKERPITFSGPMVNAILDTKKTQSRRVIKPQPYIHKDRWFYSHKKCEGWGLDYVEYANPYGTPGDRLWVRETWRPSQVEGTAWHKADGKDNEHGLWKSPMHMPRWASRILLEITDVKVEKLKDITATDILAEGIKKETQYNQHLMTTTLDKVEMSVQFLLLWDSINAKRGYGWDSNPWVWVITFKCI